MTRNPGRTFGLTLALTLLGSLMLLCALVLPALGVFDRGLATPIFIFGFLPLGFGLVGVIVTARPASLQRKLARGSGLLGEWTITPAEWEAFVGAEFGPAVNPDSRGNVIDLKARPPRAGLKVTVGDEAIQIGSQLFDLRPTGASAVLGVGTPPGRPGVLELKLGYRAQAFAPSRGELRFPLGEGQHGLPVKLAQHYPERGWSDLPARGLLQSNPAKSLRVGVWLMIVSLLVAAAAIYAVSSDLRERQLTLTVILLVVGIGFAPGSVLFVVLAWLSKRRADRTGRSG